MDDRRFDSLAKSFAAGSNRRTLLKGMLGIGAAVASGSRLTRDADAARRPKTTPTPQPVICPGTQIPCGNDCCCPNDDDQKCGPACCPAGVAECCDNACCYGHCYGEELCCPSAREWCDATWECCPDGERCCDALGCLSLGADQCCLDAECPYGSVCDLQGFSCVCAPGFLQCGDTCVEGNCCDADACMAGEACYDNSCCEPSVCPATMPASLFGCGAFGDGCGGEIDCACPEGWECTPLTNGSYCKNLTSTCIPGINLCTLDFTTALYIGTCNDSFHNFCYDDLVGGAMCALNVTCQVCTVDSDCTFPGERCIRTCDWQECPGNTACASPE